MTVEERFETFFFLLQKEGLIKGELIYLDRQYNFDSISGKITVESLKEKPEKTPSGRESKTVLRKRASERHPTSDKDTENLKKKIQSSFKPGKDFGSRYKIISKIGQGGMGTVFKARDNELNEIVALKMVKPELVRDADNIDRFIREMEIVRVIHHKNVINILNFGDVDGIAFMSMPYIEGISLQELIQSSGVLSTSDFMKIAVQACRAIQAIHDQDIIHRDLKPKNIMVNPEGRVYIMDFGLARSLVKPKITTTGQIVGTPEFMSPEQIQDQVTDLRTDIWSLGVLFYEMLTSELPFKGKNLQALINSILSKNPELPSRINPLIPKLLEKLILKCLNKEREKRYNNVKEIEEELQKISKRFRYLEPGDEAVKLHTTKKRKPADYGKRTVLDKDQDSYQKTGKKISRKIKVVVFLFVVVAIAVVAYIFLQNQNTISSGDKNSWEKARQLDSLNAYRTYLQEFPEGNYKKKAQERISQFKQDQYQKFLNQYEKLMESGQLEKALEVIRRARDFGDVDKTILLERRVEHKISEENKKQEDFDRLYELSQNSFKNKKFDSALRYISQSKQIYTTPELDELEKMVLAAKEEEKNSQNLEYEKQLKLAKKRLSQKRFDQALENIKMARVLKDTRELAILENNIHQQKKNSLKSKTVKTLELVNLPVKLVRSYYDKLRRIEIQTGDYRATITGRIFIKFGVDEKGKINLLGFYDSRLTVKPGQQKKDLVALIKSRINSITLNPPVDKSGQPVRITNWSLKYNVERVKNKLVLNISF